MESRKVTYTAKPKRSKPLWVRIAGGFFYLLICALAFAGGTVGGLLDDSSVAKKFVTTTLFNEDPREAWDGHNQVTLLILGCDKDLYYGGKKVIKQQARSDMMMVAKLDFFNNRITGVSIPRDTEVDLPGYRSQKINAYHAIGGPELARRAVEKVVPVVIDRVVVLDFDEFEKLVDMVGGVEIYVDKKMKYRDRAGGIDLDLKPGRQKLDGKNAMWYVRFRKSDDDFHRQERQKDFLLAFKDAVMKKPTLLPTVAQESMKVFGGALSEDEVVSIAQFARKVGQDNIKLGMVPTVPGRGTNLEVDQDKLVDVLYEYKLIEGSPGRSA